MEEEEASKPQIALDSEALAIEDAEEKRISHKKRKFTKEEWTEIRQAKRKAYKERKKERKRQQRLLNPPTESKDEQATASKPTEFKTPFTPKKRDLIATRFAKATQTVVIDCDWEKCMTDKEIISLCTQLANAYSANKKSEKPIETTQTNYDEMFPRDSLVYLTSEAETVLHTLDESKTYVIGGIVDHNRLKGITFERAQKKGIAMAQLPIGDYMKCSQRKVLAVNHVFQLLLDFGISQDWTKTLPKVLPQRANFKLKGDHSNETQ